MIPNRLTGEPEPLADPRPLRRVYNPVQKDYVTFVKTARETGGEYTLLEIESAAGGGNALHSHSSFAEHFSVLSGELHVQLEKLTKALQPGEQAVVPVGSFHRWYTTVPTVFRVELRPGHAGFEQALQIVYGLAADGLVNARSQPKNFYYAGVLLGLSDTHPHGFVALLLPLFRVMGKRAREKGMEAMLLERYCRIA